MFRVCFFVGPSLYCHYATYYNSFKEEAQETAFGIGKGAQQKRAPNLIFKQHSNKCMMIILRFAETQLTINSHTSDKDLFTFCQFIVTVVGGLRFRSVISYFVYVRIVDADDGRAMHLLTMVLFEYLARHDVDLICKRIFNSNEFCDELRVSTQHIWDSVTNIHYALSFEFCIGYYREQTKYTGILIRDDYGFLTAWAQFHLIIKIIPANNATNDVCQTKYALPTEDFWKILTTSKNVHALEVEVLVYWKNTTRQCHRHPMAGLFSLTRRINMSMHFDQQVHDYHLEYFICRTQLCEFYILDGRKRMPKPFKCNHNLMQIFWYP